MKKLFGLALLALAFLAPLPAEAACSGGTCFWIGGTGTIDGTSDNGHWATSSGGASCSCVPNNTTDNLTFDGSSSTGTVTVSMPGGTLTAGQITASNFNGTLDFATSNNNVVLSSATPFTSNSSVTRTLNMGSGTWTLSSNTAVWNISTGTNLTLNAGSSTIAFTGSNAANRTFSGGGKTYNIVTVSAIGNGIGQFTVNQANTFATLTISAPNRVSLTNATQTVTTLTNVSGSSSQQVLFQGNLGFGNGVISSANNWTCTYCALAAMTFSGGGAFTATNSFDLGGNSGITITSPSGGSSGGRIIGG